MRVFERKYRAFLFSLASIIAGFLVVAILPQALGPYFATFVTAIGGIFTSYSAINAVQKVGLAKSNPTNNNNDTEGET